MSTDEPLSGDQTWQSKSQQKRAVQALAHWVPPLLQLKPAALAALPGSDTLKAALREAKQLQHSGALRRQTQYIVRLLREQSEQDQQAIQAQLTTAATASQALQQQVVQWAQALLDPEQEAALLTRLHNQAVSWDRQHLRQLIRNARNAQLAAAQAEDAAQAVPCKPAVRKLQAYLRQLLGTADRLIDD